MARLFRIARKTDGTPEEPTQPEIDMIVNSPRLLRDAARAM